MWQLLLKRKIRKRWLSNILTLAGITIACAAGIFLFYQVSFTDKIYGGVYVGPFDVGGMSQNDATKFLQTQADEFLSKRIEFIAQQKRAGIYPVEFASDPGFSREYIAFDVAKSVGEAMSIGRQSNFIKNIFDTAQVFLSGKQIEIYAEIDEASFLGFLKDNFGAMQKTPENAKLELVWKNGNSRPYVKIIPERNGRLFDFGRAIITMEENIRNLKTEPIMLSLEGITPQIKTADTGNALFNLDEVLAKIPLKLSYNGNIWEIGREELSPMLVFARDKKNNVVLSLNEEKLRDKIKQIAVKVEIKPKNAQFTMQDGKVVEFQISEEGQEISKEDTIAKIKEEIFTKKAKAGESQGLPVGVGTTVEVTVREISPLVTTENINSMGITEVIGEGTSNFRGSPVNRRFNISNGAQKLHGIVIAPGQVFSLVKTLGEISARTGYKAELVIKGDRTTAEFGGGLCQIATTAFRAALSAGLPILERRNHSYRVSYYEPPAGMDATIYNPNPDLKFKNDTGHHILAQAAIDGDILKFTFWGTKDGRVAESSAPVIWNIASPAPTKLVETLDLPVGKKKCTEVAHKGADVYFDYKVTYPGEDPVIKRFSSHYRPWQEVCLIGVSALSASSTPLTSAQ